MDARVPLNEAPGASASFKPIDWSKAYRNSQFQHLLRFKSNRIRPAIILYFFAYVSLSTLAGFAPAVMSTKLIGAFTAGYALILLTYLVAFIVAFWYVRVADTEFDPLVSRAVESIEAEGVSK